MPQQRESSESVSDERRSAENGVGSYGEAKVARGGYLYCGEALSGCDLLFVAHHEKGLGMQEEQEVVGIVLLIEECAKNVQLAILTVVFLRQSSEEEGRPFSWVHLEMKDQFVRCLCPHLAEYESSFPRD